MPCIGQIDQYLHIIGYLKSHPKRKLGFDLEHPTINENRFQDCDRTEFYQDVSEVIPGNYPVNRGNHMLTQ